MMAIVALMLSLWSDRDARAISCGPAAVSLAARLVERPCTPAELREAFEGRLDGEHSLEELCDAAQKLGLQTREAFVDADGALAGGVPLIVAARSSADAAETNHFVVIYGRTDRGVQVLDPPRPPRFIPPPVLRRYWDGTGFYVAASPDEFARLPSSWTLRAWLALGGGGLLLTLSLAALLWSARRRRPPGGRNGVIPMGKAEMKSTF